MTATPTEEIVRLLREQSYPEAKIAAFLAACELSRTRAPQRRLYERDFSGPTWVYVIVDPRTRRPFYVGITMYLWYRFDQHRTDPGSAAWGRINELLAAGYAPNRIYKPYRCCADRNEALRLEYKLITAIPDLLNRSRQRPWSAMQ